MISLLDRMYSWCDNDEKSTFLKHFYWSIIALQWCVSFCCITKWISYTYTYIPIKIWNASRICVSSLRRGHANLLCIVNFSIRAAEASTFLTFLLWHNIHNINLTILTIFKCIVQWHEVHSHCCIDFNYISIS